MIEELITRLSKCPDYTCARCSYAGTDGCAINEAIRELKRFDQVIAFLKKDDNDDN